MGRKLGGVPPSNTMWPGPRPTCVPSDMLIHPAVWPQDMGRKVGGCLLPFGGCWAPSNTMLPKLRLGLLTILANVIAISISILSDETIGNTDTDTFAKSISDTFAATFTDTFCCCNLR